MNYIGDFSEGSLVCLFFSTNSQVGARTTPSSSWEAADIKIYKNSSTTERSSSSGITVSTTFDSLTGIHLVTIDLSDNTDAGFYAPKNDYTVVLYPDETIDSQEVSKVLAQFSIENRVTDLRRINGELTNENSATLKLKQLHIVNDAGDAVLASSTEYGSGVKISSTSTTSGPYAALQITGYEGEGVSVLGGTNKDAISLLGNGSGYGLNSQGDAGGVMFKGLAGPGLFCTSVSDGSYGIAVIGCGNGGHGIITSGGASTGGVGTGGDGFRALGGLGTSHGISVDSGNVAGAGVSIDGVDGLRILNGVVINAKTNGIGVFIAGNGTGDGMRISGGATGPALNLYAAGHHALYAFSASEYAARFEAGHKDAIRIIGGTDADSKGVIIESTATSGAGDALKLIESASGKAIEATQINTILTRIGTPSDLGSGANLSSNAVDIYGQGTSLDSAIAIIDGIVDAILVDTTAILVKIGTPSNLGSGATLAANTVDLYAQGAAIDAAVVVVDGVVDSIKVDTTAIKIDTGLIVSKLPSGTISDYDPAIETVEGVTHNAILELVMAMVNGRFRKDFPAAGQVTFYKRDNVTVLFTVNVSTSERTRV